MKRIVVLSLAALTASGVYLFAWPSANLFYAGLVLFHVGLGVLFCLVALRFIRDVLRASAWVKAGALVTAVGAAIGIALIFTGTTRPYARLLLSHEIASAIGVVLLGAWWWAHRQTARRPRVLRTAGVLAVAAIVVSAGGWYTRQSWSKKFLIKNPPMAPLTMDGEGDGPNGPFFPSSSQVAGSRKIPSKFFMESDACMRCHQDAYDQWNSSAHHFSSFNNQWYRKSIEYMQDVAGVKPSKWCAGCHDPALLYSGMMDTPIKEIVHRPEAQAGLGCMMCHSIAQVKSTMGQGDFMLEYPELHELAATKNPVMKWIHDFSIKLNPEPHRRVFLKPFMKNQTAEFCSSCHKVHLDVPVNGYRWIRGFNEYDNWQASGVSGFGARSFYYPQQPQECGDCHMPEVASKDMGNIKGKIHSHAFPGANTALPFVNKDEGHLELVKSFLEGGNLSVDVFALSRTAAPPKGGAALGRELSTSFAVGEEGEMAVAHAEESAPAAPVTAPLNRADAAVRRGESVRLDMVVRTKKVGHFFPGGTVDAYDTWLELKAVDDKGQTVFWSGAVEDEGKGPVEKGAHFYRSLMIDANGNPINKRNAWSTRAVVYVRLIPPGAADTAHYRLQVPENAGSKITVTGRLLYRKFAWWNTQFSFAGVSNHSGQPNEVTRDYDNRKVTFDGDTSKVSGQIKAIPDLPIAVLATNTIDLRVLPKNAPVPEPKVVLQKDDWQRWNDYGIGLFLQGDLKAAAAAFQKVTEVDPQNPDGWVNLGRVAVQEGDMERARTVLQKALQISPDLARAKFFYAKVLRSDGNYDGALAELKAVLAQYPKDRVVRNDAGRILFLQRKYNEAIAQFKEAIAIDPEDLQANYNLMLCYKGLGQEKMAADYEKLYLRFKADESAQTLTGEYRRLNPEDNNERQVIHEHVSVPLGSPARAKKVATTRTKQESKKIAYVGSDAATGR